MDVSIVIVNWNTKELLHNCLESIYEQAGEVDYEIIVVDNASSDESVEMVLSKFPAVIVISNETNRGFAAANNQGIRIAKGKYILLLNSDTVICDRAVEKTLSFAANRPKAGVIGCQVWENSKSIQMTCFRFPSLRNLFLETTALSRIFKKNHFFGRERMLWWGRDSERQVDVVSGMFMLVRKEAIDDVGLMDESYFLYSEETDWCYRFSKAGWEILFWPGARIIHVDGGSHSSKQAESQMHLQKRTSMLIFFRKHYGLKSFVLARLLLLLHAGIRLTVLSVVAISKQLLGKSAASELKVRQGHWWTLKFCLFGSEPGCETYQN